MAGVVAEADSGSRFSVGDRVFGLGTGASSFKNTYGSYAEFTVISEGHVVPIPESITDEQAAGVPLAGMTAFQV